MMNQRPNIKSNNSFRQRASESAPSKDLNIGQLSSKMPFRKQKLDHQPNPMLKTASSSGKGGNAFKVEDGTPKSTS